MYHSGRLIVSAVGLPHELRQVAGAERLVDRILEREIEGGRSAAGGLDPPLDGIIVGIPVFAYTIGGIGVCVVDLIVLTSIPLDHIIAESCITPLCEQLAALILAI
ncbi:MAG: hypothetical protein K2H21_07495, partial [Muribaculaceae bacterium]|nr:hypothetical protein [Muribaculaceae bacterium]